MNMKTIKHGLALTALLAVAGQASAATFHLCAGSTTKTMPDDNVITMWGFAPDDDSDLSNGCGYPVTVPGPELTVPEGDDTLTVNLRNELGEPVSIVISGQQATMVPVFFTDGQGRQRVRSFTKETAPASLPVAYTWNNIKPGTFLYSSGTHPAVQVQMGLYGAVTQDAAAGQAYAGISYDNEVTLLYSEIDPALHAAVAGNDYGPGKGMTSTINYAPKYFLVNGNPFVDGDAPLSAGAADESTLIRFLNAGLEDHAMVLQGQHMNLVAEDGNVYPYQRTQYSVFLAAGKTKDAIFTPAADGTYQVYDRRLRSGMLTNLSVAAAAPGPTAVDDPATTAGATIAEDTTVTTIDVLANDTVLPSYPLIDLTTIVIGSPAVNGLAIANIDGTVTYTPNPDFNGSDSFTYTVRDTAGNLSNNASVSISVTPVNDNPLATDDSYSTTEGTTLDVAAPGVLDNDNDIDGDPLTTAIVTNVTAGTLTLDPDGSFSYTPNAGTTTDSFTYSANDSGGGTPSNATVTINVTSLGNQPPVANDDYDTVTRNTGNSTNNVTIDVVGNDTDIDGTIDAATVIITSNPHIGTVMNNGNGTVTYTPTAGRRGSDAFGYTVNDDLGATSNEATVRVDIVK